MRRLLTPRWLLVHLLVVVLVAVMSWLAWWQINRAWDGNALSIGYSLEWPVFAGFVIFFWLRAMRQEAPPPVPDQAPAPTVGKPPASDVIQQLSAQRAAARSAARTDDPETAAYNHYLAWLNAHPNRHPTDYPGETS